MRTLNPVCSNFLDTGNHRFSPFHNGFDNTVHELRSEGIGSEAKQAECFTKEEEEILWVSEVLTTKNPKGLYITCSILFKW